MAVPALSADPTPFEIVVNKLITLGFYDFFFPFLILTVIMYALLRKSKILGDSNVISAVVALAVGMLILGFPVVVGMTFTTELSTFFVQSTVWILVIVVAVIMASIVYPDMGRTLSEQFKTRSFMWYMLIITLGIFITSGLVGVITNVGNPALTGDQPETPGPPADLVLIMGALIIFMVLIAIAASIMGGSRGGN